MTPETLNEAINEAERFLRKAKKAKSGVHKNEYGSIEFASQSDTAAVKRASMDLTKALAAIRRSQYA